MSIEVSALPSPTGPFSPRHNNMSGPSFEMGRSMDTCSSSKASMTSRFRDLVRFLSSVSGDLSNVTAPPFFLAPSSVVEVGHCWSQRPGVFAAPALEPDPARRGLLVLRMILIAMRSQFYVAGSPTVSIKKPLNAFLGELFMASSGKLASTRLVAEQVSHHPPITAMAIIDDENGIRADGYARVEMTFSSSVDIKQVGHAILSIDRYDDEKYLIPLPDVKVRGFLSGRLYPEVLGTYTIVSSSGYVSEMTFSGAGVFRGKKNSFQARMYRKDDPKKTPIYEVEGCWSEGWTVKDSRTGEVLEKYDVDAVENRPAPMHVAPIEKQDPWESRRAWAGVVDALDRGEFRDVVAEKSKLEQAQRRMRAEERRTGTSFEPLLFRSCRGEEHAIFHQLAEGTSWQLDDDKTKGVWRVDDDKVAGAPRPFRGGLTPLG
ncbi:Oxysterol-binding protein [Cryphonectria parasitica EP155]|uniref:Oxysterol-binding protein n=1 Tax=Cryphonectria parasitica (strain ATCC 38755 / EP155) TaxID=660469 RepID=A0A9P5CIT8_CRYP1|nr:Oxysterol-binding protein [Cryphonectria parasitica EP155]KAF3760924.1 Oxysterol-binding protein [Cryphonectria parasitica EP155]